MIPPAIIKLRTSRRTRVFIGLSGLGCVPRSVLPDHLMFACRKFVGCSKTERFVASRGAEMVVSSFGGWQVISEKRYGSPRPWRRRHRHFLKIRIVQCSFHSSDYRRMPDFLCFLQSEYMLPANAQAEYVGYRRYLVKERRAFLTH